MIKGAIFDIDGTLLDSMPVWENAGARYLATQMCIRDSCSDVVCGLWQFREIIL